MAQAKCRFLGAEDPRNDKEFCFAVISKPALAVTAGFSPLKRFGMTRVWEYGVNGDVAVAVAVPAPER